MANITQFANTNPNNGEIRAFYNVDSLSGDHIVRALTVHENAIGGIDVVPTLQNLQSLKMKITSSGDFSSFKKISATKKGNYFFIDNVDLTFADISSSLSSSVVFDPFISENFYNNDYNVLISNSEDIRTGTKRYKLNRSAGTVHPSNFNAAVGIEVNRIGFDDEDHNSFVNNTVFNTTAGQSTVTTAPAPFRNDTDVEVSVTRDSIVNALGNVNGAVILKDPEEKYNHIFTVKLEINPQSNFSGTGETHTLALVEYTDGSYLKTINPYRQVIPSGSYGDFIYTRIKVINSPGISYSGATPLKRVIGTITSLDKTTNYTEVRYATPEFTPYAEPAEVQDSNYTSIGVSNARYRGSKTSKEEFSGIDSAINAQTINVLRLTEGSISSSFDNTQAYGRSWLNINSLLNGISGSDGLRKEYENAFEEISFTGVRDKPATRVGNVGEFYTGPNAYEIEGSATHTFDIFVEGYGQKILPGDLLSFESGSGLSEKKEYMQVISVSTKYDAGGTVIREVKTVQVLRGRGPDGNANLDAGDSANDNHIISLASGDRLIDLQGNRVIPFSNAKFVLNPDKVKDAPDEMIIVETNNQGFIFNTYVTGSQDGTL